MSNPTPPGGVPIEQLLQDRAQFASWLVRLDASGETSVPEPVRARVRADYQRRLNSVLEELKGHTAALEEQGRTLNARRSELAGQEAQHQERLAEAEVRHMVGEYDEGTWQSVRAELMRTLVAIREELGRTTIEAGRINEVLATVRQTVSSEPPASQPGLTRSAPRPAVVPPPIAPTPPQDGERPAATELPFRPATPRPQSRIPPAAGPDEVGRTLWFPSGKQEPPAGGGGGGSKLDELAFLKSVAPSEPAEAPAARPRPPAAPEPMRPPEPAPAVPAAAGGEMPRERSSPGAPPSSGTQKTLKCGECGSLNRPTEWYCEQCGAELASL